MNSPLGLGFNQKRLPLRKARTGLKTTRLKNFAAELARRNQLDLFPLGKHLRCYSAEAFQGDARAGFNVALLAFPQGMAYALIAGLPIEYGIFGSAVAAIVAAFFAGSRFITLGPTNATSVMLYSSFASIGITTSADAVGYMPILLLMIGLFLVVGAYLRVANLIQYISQSVVTGYITAAALLIISGQIKNVIGVSFSEGEKAITFVDKIVLTIKHMPEFHHESVVLSILTFVIFYILKKKWSTLPNVAITLVIVSGIAAGLSELSTALSSRWDLKDFWTGDEIRWLGEVNAAAWPVTLPSMNFDAISQMANIALAIALLCVLEGTSIGKSLAARSGERLDANQEMLAIGTANIGCAFFAGMPASGSLTRSQLSWSSGGRTPLASLLNGLIVAGGAFLIGPLIRYVPQSVLAVLVITIGISLINKRAIKVVTKSTRSDAATFFATFIAGLLFPLDTAIYMGVGLSIMLFLRKAATPELVEYGFTDEGELAELEEKKKRAVQEVSIVHVEGDLFFGAAEIFRDQMRRASEDENLKIVIVKMRNARHLDATAVMAIEELVKHMNERDRFLLLSECKKDVIRVLKNSEMLNVLNRKNVFPDNPQNPTLSTAKALKRAQEILGDAEVDIKIYVNANKKKKKSEGLE
ncbi:SulP family inorganic anion transporter [Rubellicoccus peritrichatus]|uniref:SulP family inorganic anion transporter n=1 Tax=Rubellicoccus peritrichatus TaxID=3080537 RepID=A0AAQ3LJG8_9BACT|nr:SulP family inorganic anion transporter [Puniceicoccus sp. CR14]WOO43339.1 SulP family inorganic anion transporter [Puniceicoccus sp. CR14]